MDFTGDDNDDDGDGGDDDDLLLVPPGKIASYQTHSLAMEIGAYI